MQIEALKALVIESLDDIKAKDVEVLDVSRLTSVTDWMVVASGTSTRHVSALANSVITNAKTHEKKIIFHQKQLPLIPSGQNSDGQHQMISMNPLKLLSKKKFLMILWTR